MGAERPPFFMESISDIFNALSPNPCNPFFLPANASSTIEHIKPIPFPIQSDSQASLNLPWYSYLSALNSAISSHWFTAVKTSIESYSKGDQQFPADYLKAVRLYSLLDVVSPSQILELGSGTSSAIISSFTSDAQHECDSITIDASQEWLNTTQSKIQNISKCKNHSFFASRNSKEIEELLRSWIKNDSTLFIFLDAKIIANDPFQGLGLITNISDILPNKFIILIDSRQEAVKNLHHLANQLNKGLAVQTSFNHLATDLKVKLSDITSGAFKSGALGTNISIRTFAAMTATTIVATRELLKSR